MSLIRKLALKISGIVVRYSSPGCKEWAEGLATEAALIEQDWSALSWAIGSIRVLFDRREAPIKSLDEVPATARKFADSRHNATAIWVAVLFQALIYALNFLTAKNWLQHLGCGIAVIGSISIGLAVLIERRRLNPYFRGDIEDEVLFYKQELERARYRFHTPENWIAFAGINLLVIGASLSLQPQGLGRILVVFSVLLVAWLQLHRNRVNRRRLEQLQSLLAKKP